MFENQHADITVTKYLLLTILQSHYEKYYERTDFSRPAPPPRLDANPFQDNGLPLSERYLSATEEIQVKINFLAIIRN